jgi:hypothetical protein
MVPAHRKAFDAALELALEGASTPLSVPAGFVRSRSGDEKLGLSELCESV